MGDLKEKVTSWINEQGYPLEMLVAKRFREAGFRTFQSEYYIDPESGDSREIDVVASTQTQVGEMLAKVTFCIECKISRKHPWIIFTSRDTSIAEPASVVQRTGTLLAREFLIKIAQNKYAHNAPFFKVSDRNGYSLTEAFTSGKDNAYSSCLSVSKCAKAIAIRGNETSKIQKPLCNIILPVILIQGKLFECHQDSSELEVNETQRSILMWRNQASNTGHSIINICTEEALGSLIKDASKLAKFIFAQTDTLKNVEEEFLSIYENRRRLGLAGMREEP